MINEKDCCEECGFKEDCKKSIEAEVYDDALRLWQETYERSIANNEPSIAWDRFRNKYERR